MLSSKEFIKRSIELNLFYQRIMKEHLLLIETHLPCSETAHMTEAKILKLSFERLLGESVLISKGIIDCEHIDCSDAVTQYTLDAERLTSILTGTKINLEITKALLELDSSNGCEYSDSLHSRVMDINIRSLNILKEVIEFKKKILSLKLTQKMEVLLYPTMLEHLIDEACLYEEILKCLTKNELPKKSLCENLNFWNHILREHAEFTDGMLDPSEKDLKEIAKKLVDQFGRLVKECMKVNEKEIIKKSTLATEEMKSYNADATKGILHGDIKSIIPPILADHLLREANHFLKILRDIK